MTSLANVIDMEPGTATPLFAPEAERALVGEILYNPQTAKTAAGIVAPTDFGDDRFGQVYGLVVGLVAAAPDARTVDTMTVVAEIRKRRKDSTGGTRWPDDGELAILATSGTGVIDAPARLVLDASLRRMSVLEARGVISAAHTVSDATTLAPDAAARFARIRDAHTPAGRMATKTLREVMEAVVDDTQDWVIPGLLERGDRLVVTGEEGLGKTTFLRQIAICAAAGLHPLKLTPIKPVTVVVVDAENSERQWRRQASGIVTATRLYGNADPLDAVHVACMGRIDITSPADLAGVHRLLDEHDPEILVIGPLYKLLPRAINNDDDAAPLIAALDSLRDRGVCLLIEAHAGHATTGAGGTRDLRPRGSSALLGWPEFGFGLGRNAQAPDAVADVRRWRGDRESRDWPDKLIRGGTMPWSDENEKAASPSYMRRQAESRHHSEPRDREEPY